MPVIQLVALAIIGASGGPRVLLGIYIPLIVIAAVLAALFMDNIASVKNDTGAAKDAAKDPHTWIMSFLYIGTFGSFIGYSFAFGQVLTNQFGRTPLEAAYVTFIGPLLGSLIRPLGGWLADKYGGSKITLYNYVGMGAATAVLIVASMQKSLTLFTCAFVVLFVLSGLGNGSTFKMIPGIFQTKALAKGLEGEAAAAYGRRLSGASMGLIGAVGALGGVGINLAFRQSFLSYGSGTGAFVAFLAFYGACFVVTWAVYLRRPARQATATAATDTKPQLNYAEV
ncbi:NarK/NasA family nitrate transporter OS=Streptomyces alboniger OX=132473 GN=CP975_13360 PE=3 SV=1 [Streptomyces alboniger]